jgi:hypothetical protein
MDEQQILTVTEDGVANGDVARHALVVATLAPVAERDSEMLL